MTIKLTQEGKYQALLKSENLGIFETEKGARSAYRKKLREKYREKEKEACRVYYQTHKEYFRRKAAERVLTPDQRERQRKYSAEYYKTNTKHKGIKQMTKTITWSDSLDNLFKVLRTTTITPQKIQTFEDESHDITFRTKQDLNTFRTALKEMKEATK